ncbi:MAG TPA: DNA recombination protein RmuC [Candidatus Saccharibacteria bacterium]|nr:DNA recombination protein RmuC [Candidatus Saccharibacteria bacterium]MCB9817305.1 DNA recombination protein RmuC [Candidatus Nomurabacteria bacterium]HPD99174.1 DNA recombination protein RmuC [Candidatus Saccharibacteria bacterium]HPR10468.1 DNA recombination protein RmuC [Candidatus Saccharibacteria bacterium]
MDVITIVLIVLTIVLLATIMYLVYALRRSAAPAITNNEIQNLNNRLDAIKDSLNITVNDRLDKNTKLMSDTMQQQFSQSAKLIADVTNRLTKLDETNKRVVDVADELKMLQNVLQNPKQRGGIGEYYLDVVLGNVLPSKLYQLQYKFADGEIVDAVIKLDKGRLLAIDSKFSLENYNRLVEETDKTKRVALAKLFKADLKNRIDETAKYIRPAENTLDYAFMFIPSEAIYYDLLINQVGMTNTSARDLLEYAFIDKKVIIVSPTTLLAYLQTVLQGLRSLQIEEQAKEIQKRVGELGKHIATHETYMQKLGTSLGTTVNHFNTAHKELKKMDKDVIKIAHTDASVEPLVIEKPKED